MASARVRDDRVANLHISAGASRSTTPPPECIHCDGALRSTCYGAAPDERKTADDEDTLSRVIVLTPTISDQLHDMCQALKDDVDKASLMTDREEEERLVAQVLREIQWYLVKEASKDTILHALERYGLVACVVEWVTSPRAQVARLACSTVETMCAEAHYGECLLAWYPQLCRHLVGATRHPQDEVVQRGLFALESLVKSVDAPSRLVILQTSGLVPRLYELAQHGDSLRRSEARGVLREFVTGESNIRVRNALESAIPSINALLFSPSRTTKLA